MPELSHSASVCCETLRRNRNTRRNVDKICNGLWKIEKAIESHTFHRQSHPKNADRLYNASVRQDTTMYHFFHFPDNIYHAKNNIIIMFDQYSIFLMCFIPCRWSRELQAKPTTTLPNEVETGQSLVNSPPCVEYGRIKV